MQLPSGLRLASRMVNSVVADGNTAQSDAFLNPRPRLGLIQGMAGSMGPGNVRKARIQGAIAFA
jgi:hypothetical protein